MATPTPPLVRENSSYLVAKTKASSPARIGPRYQAVLPTRGARSTSASYARVPQTVVEQDAAAATAAVLTAAAYDESEARTLTGWRADYADEMPSWHPNAGALHYSNIGVHGKRKMCTTPGCTLPEYHDGLCTSQRVHGSRARKPSAIMRGGDMKMWAASEAGLRGSSCGAESKAIARALAAPPGGSGRGSVKQPSAAPPAGNSPRSAADGADGGRMPARLPAATESSGKKREAASGQVGPGEKRARTTVSPEPRSALDVPPALASSRVPGVAGQRATQPMRTPPDEAKSADSSAT